GFFVNTLVIRSHYHAESTFAQYLKQIRDTALDGYAHQDIPFEKLVEAIQPERQLSHHPLFQVMFALQNAPVPTYFASDLQAKAIETHSGQAKFDLFFSLFESDEQIGGQVEYQCQLFKESTIHRFINSYQLILEAVCEQQEIRLKHIEIVSQQEKQQILIGWNDTHKTYATPKLVHQWVEQSANQMPDNIAIYFNGVETSYQQLDKQANQVAHYLNQQNIGLNDQVGLLLPRSTELVTMMLAVLKAGACYIPLDPEYPQDRLKYMLDDAKISILISQEKQLKSIQDYQGTILDLANSQTDIENCPESPLLLSMSNNELAYIIYTSGSTGRPKGVSMPHRSLVNLLSWQQEQSHVSQDDSTLQYAPSNFDVSFQEIFSTWSQGGRLVIVDGETRRDFNALIELIRQQSIARLFMPFIALQHLAKVSDVNQQTLVSLKEVITAGEQLKITDEIRLFFSKIPQCQLINQYGPSETHVITANHLNHDIAEWADLPNIGYPISNSKIYILDNMKQIVPVGVMGELCVAGECLSAGYFNRQDLTDKVFVNHSFSEDHDELIYHTGDYARFLEKGAIEYLGRMDDQVKIRGYRVELGEIETLLTKHNEIKDIVVKNQDDHLVAFYSTEDHSEIDKQSLLDSIKDQLPDYMLPSVFISLEQLPTTPSGKIDRKALRVSRDQLQNNTQEYIKPQGFMEELLAGFWGDLLAQDKISAHDNFFELGGHSLLVTQLVSLIK
ncbi:MAG: amino acid adenylation domain-containing protein, partial [Methylococcales bacterium]|nr:amino acid adenylation domain-containing protein [Methylococcales bacterium]